MPAIVSKDTTLSYITSVSVGLQALFPQLFGKARKPFSIGHEVGHYCPWTLLRSLGQHRRKAAHEAETYRMMRAILCSCFCSLEIR